jgi:hypothetical protein
MNCPLCHRPIVFKLRGSHAKVCAKCRPEYYRGLWRRNSARYRQEAKADNGIAAAQRWLYQIKERHVA